MIISRENIVFGEFIIKIKQEQFTYKCGKTKQTLVVEVYKGKELLDDIYLPLGEVNND